MVPRHRKRGGAVTTPTTTLGLGYYRSVGGQLGNHRNADPYVDILYPPYLYHYKIESLCPYKIGKMVVYFIKKIWGISVKW